MVMAVSANIYRYPSCVLEERTIDSLRRLCEVVILLPQEAMTHAYMVRWPGISSSPLSVADAPNASWRLKSGLSSVRLFQNALVTSCGLQSFPGCLPASVRSSTIVLYVTPGDFVLLMETDWRVSDDSGGGDGGCSAAVDDLRDGVREGDFLGLLFFRANFDGLTGSESDSIGRLDGPDVDAAGMGNGGADGAFEDNKLVKISHGLSSGILVL